MSLRHSLGSSKQRPLSAIFIGSPSQDHIQSQLPSPPSTQGSGDGSIRAKSRNDLVMNDASNRPASRASQSLPRRREATSSDDDDEHDRLHDDDQDHTARLSERPSTASISRAASRAGYSRGDPDAAAMQRSQSIAARHRQVMETLDAVTTNGRLTTPSPRPPASRSPVPRPASRISAGRPRPRQDTFSGSETERERGIHSPDDHSTPPTSAHQARFEDVYQPDEQATPSQTLRRSPKLTMNGGTFSRRRGQSVMEIFSPAESSIFKGAVAAALNDPPTSIRTSPHRLRDPLPREFTDRHRSYDGYNRSRGISPEDSRQRSESRNQQRDYPPSPTTNRPPSRDYKRPVSSSGRPSRDLPQATNRLPFPSSSAMTASSSGMTSSSSGGKSGRFATVRERRTPSHQRWASESIQSPDEEVNLNNSRGDEPRWRYQSRGGSAESALGAGRSLIGEGLKAAGLTRRTEEDVFDDADRSHRAGKQQADPPPNGSATMYSSSSSSAVSDVTTESQALEMRRERLARLTDTNGRDPKTPFNGRDPRPLPSNSARGLTSRPATSMDHASHHPSRTAPPQLRSYNSAYERAPPLPPLSAALDRRPAYSTPGPMDEQHRLSVPPSRSAGTFSSSPAPDHSRILQEAFRSFEGNVRRAGSTIHPAAASGCVSAAETLVQAASILNSLLRTNLDRATHEQIEAEVGEEDALADPELWRQVGSEFRESVKVSDEIIRTMTAFLLDVGKVMRDAASVSAGRIATPPPGAKMMGPPSSTGSGSHSNSHLRTMSLDEEALAARRSEGGSSADGRSSNGHKRSRQSVDGASVSSGGRDPNSDRISSEFGGRQMDDQRATGSLSLRRLASRRSDTSYEEQRRAPSSMSVARSGGDRRPERVEEDQRYEAPPPVPALLPREEPRRKPSVLTALSAGKRLFHPKRTQGSPTVESNSPLTGRADTIDEMSPSPMARTASAASDERRRRFPSLHVPPPLSTLPSESILERRATQQRSQPPASGAGANLSRKKTSTGSTATVTHRAGGARFPSLTSPSKPTTQITPTTVSTGVDREVEPPRTAARSSQFSNRSADTGNRSANAATIGSSSSRHVLASLASERQRTLSNLSATDDLPDEDELEDWQVGSMATVVDRSRFGSMRSNRASLDGGLSTRDPRRDRRRTAGEIFG